MKQEILSIDLNILEFFCVPLYSGYLFDLHKKFPVASTYAANVEYQSMEFFLLVFGDIQIKDDTQGTYIHRPTAKNVFFRFW